MPHRLQPLSTVAVCGLLLGTSTGCSMINAYPDVDRDEQATTKGEEPSAAPWTRGFGGVGDDVASAVAIGAEDSIVLAGSFSNTIDFGLGPLHSYGGTDAFLLGLDRDGDVLWNAAWGGSSNDFVDGLVVTPDGDFVVAFPFTGTADLGGQVLAGTPFGFGLVKYRADGEIVWARALGGFKQRTLGDLAVTEDGGLILSGHLNGTVDFGFGPVTSVGEDDLFVLRLDASGATKWCHHLTSGTSLEATGANYLQIHAAPDGSVLLAGFINQGMDFGDLVIEPGDGVPFVGKLTPDGEMAWVQSPKSPGDLVVYKDVALDVDGSVVTVGAYFTPSSFGASPGGLMLTRFDGDGAQLDERRFEAALHTNWSIYPVSIVPNRVDGFTVLGYLEKDLTVGQHVLKSVGGQDTFVVRFGADLEPLDARRFGDGEDESPWAAAVDSQGSVIVGGAFTGQLRVDQESMVSAGLTDAFLAKLVWE